MILGGPFGARTYATSTEVATDTNQFSVRIDHRISDQAQMFVRFNLNDVTGPLTNPEPASYRSKLRHPFSRPPAQRGAQLHTNRLAALHLRDLTRLHPDDSDLQLSQPRAARDDLCGRCIRTLQLGRRNHHRS